MIKKAAAKIKKVLRSSDDPFDPNFLETLEYKTPYFLFSRKKILANYKEFKRLFPNSIVHFAMKANSEPEVLKLLADEGAGFEVASKYELEMLKPFKIPSDRIVYGTSVKPVDHIKEFVKYGVDRFAFDSFPELEKIASAAPGAKVYVRTIANDAGSVFKFSSKFGTDQASIIPLLVRAKALGLHPYGISFHVGSQASDVNAWAEEISSLRSIIQDLFDIGIKLDVLNIGGGYPCRYISSENAPTLKDIAKVTVKEYEKLPYQMNLILEPGRGIIANTAVCVATVIARVERMGTAWLFLDAGVYNAFFETMAYQGSTRYLITSMRPATDAGESMFAIAGPTGDSPDIVTKEVLLTSDIEVGDKLIIHDVGAYSLSTSMEFNGFPKPKVYLV
ncbi:MAG TPA: type III PLP-dependent enzyme [Candidatus Saccharimonadales bacterium]|nr:type III PLP-dependent enzyme [Candidatus Saccharimonadales bacterium]